jgi:long-chain acyl-CoA synthetase
MEKIWLKNYELGVPHTIDPDQYPSLNELFEESCRVYKNRIAFLNMGQGITYIGLEEKTRAFAAYLQSNLGLKKGDRFGIMLPNLLQYPVAMFGALRAGLVVVNINPLYTPRELEIQLQDSSVTALVVLANFVGTVAKVLPNTELKQVIVTELGDLFSFYKSYWVNWTVKYLKKMVPAWAIPNHIMFKEVLKIGASSAYQNPKLHGEDIAYLQYTGGTTGKVKGAILTHRNMIANLEQASAWIANHVKKGEEIIITALPLYHIFSLMANCLTYFKMGATNVLITNPRDINGFIKELRRYPFTAITGVNTLFHALLNHPEFTRVNFHTLSVALGGGMALQKMIAKHWQAVTGKPLLEAYGLTEAAPAVCINPLSLQEFNGSIGLPLPSTDISITDEAGQELGLNTPGELWIRGPQVIKAYWKMPEETKAALKEDWLKTGDIATVDEAGFVRLVDRKKDVILVSGFNVYPNEIEEVIATLEGVLEVAVIGVADNTGERVKAFIVRRDLSLTKERIIGYCKEYLTHYKIPKEIEFRTELPRTHIGKISRRALREAS